jgi:hypothetical protein
VSRSGFLTFFHDYMRQAVEARYLRPQNRYNQFRMRIVAYFNRYASRSMWLGAIAA